MPHDDTGQMPPAFAKSGAGGEWVASRYADVQAVLADDRFGVAEAGPPGAAGTISWLRASVSRFVNGPEHQRRRSLAVAQLSLLEPGELRRAAQLRTYAAMAPAAVPGAQFDVMERLARRVPMTVLAAALGITFAEAAAEATIMIAAAYSGGTCTETQEKLAGTATESLIGMLGPAELDVIVARIGLMAQACDATAGLIGTALHAVADAPAASRDWPTPALLSEVLRHHPVVTASRRVARAPVSVKGEKVLEGDAVICDVAAANRDPARYARPDRFDTAPRATPSLTFGYGVRPCPGQPQALALAAGVVDAVREACDFLPGRRVPYQPGTPLRIPARLDVVLRQVPQPPARRSC